MTGSQPVSRMAGADDPGETMAQFVCSLPTATRSAGTIRPGSTPTCTSSRASTTSRWPVKAFEQESKIPPTGDLTHGVPAPAGTWPLQSPANYPADVGKTGRRRRQPAGARKLVESPLMTFTLTGTNLDAPDAGELAG